MPRTRNQRAQQNSPLLDFDLDPFQSNRSRFNSRNPSVASSVGTTIISSPLPSLTDMSDLDHLGSRNSVGSHQSEQINRGRSPAIHGPQPQPPNSSLFHFSNQSVEAYLHGSHYTPSPSPSFAPQYHQSVVQIPYHHDQNFQSAFNRPLPPLPVHSSPRPYITIPSPQPLIQTKTGSPTYHETQYGREKRPEEYRVKDLSVQLHLKSDGSNYFTWTKMIKQILRGNTWMGFVDNSLPKPLYGSDPRTIEKWEQVDSLVTTQLTANMDANLYSDLSNDFNTAAELWGLLHQRFGERPSMALSNASVKLRSKKIQPGESMKEHVQVLRDLRSEYVNCGRTLSEFEWHDILVLSLGTHPDWRNVMPQSAIYPKPESFISFLLLQETNGFVTVKKEQALQVQSRGNKKRNPTGSPCTNCNLVGHSAERCFAPGGGSAHRRPSWYKIPTHLIQKERANLAAQIQALDQYSSGSSTESADRAKIEVAQYAGPVISPPKHVALVASFVRTQSNVAIREDSWLLDSGASSHMTNDRHYFSSYNSIPPIEIQTARKGITLQGIGRGTIRVRFVGRESSCEVSISDVLHVPDLTHNLVSLSKLDQAGVEFRSLKGQCTLIKGDFAIGWGQSIEDQWLLNMTPVMESALLLKTIAETKQPLFKWHQRLGHVNQQRIKHLHQTSSVDDLLLSDIQEIKCEPCILSKMTASPSPSVPLRATQPGDIIHADLEFMNKRSFSGAEISLKFLDEFSNSVWVYALTAKNASTILDHWKVLHATFLTQFSIRIKALHSDNGTEFVNGAMQAFNLENGLNHHLTVPYRHEMNGRIERMNRTGSDCVRSMLQDSQLPDGYWAEAYQTFAYIHNRTSSSAVESKTPFEVLHHTKPSVGHIRKFGSVCYMRIPPEKRLKLDCKALKCILVGYREDAAYRLMDPTSRDIFYSRDVIFDEDSSFKTARDPSADNEIHLLNDRDDVPLPSLMDIQATKSVRRSNRPMIPSKRLIQSQEQELALKHLDEPPHINERVTLANHQRFVQNIPIPRSSFEALNSPQSAHWKTAMEYENTKLTEMGCWDVIERPDDTHVIKGMWVFNIKEEADGSLEYRARWVARGDSQIPGLEFGETFAASGDFITAKIIVALSAHDFSTLVTIDISSAYLHSPLEQDNLVVEYPSGFSVPHFNNPCCKLKRALYGLRQGARAWSQHFTSKLSEIGFTQCTTAPSVYYRSTVGGETILSTHVDDCNASCQSFNTSRDHEAISFKSDVGKLFKFKEKNPRDHINVLGMTAFYDEDNNFTKLSVPLKIERALQKYGLSNANTFRTPMATNALTIFERDTSEAFDDPPWPYSQLVGELLWIGTILRIDIAFAVNILARYMHRPKLIHWTAAKRVLCYLKGTKNLGIVYAFNTNNSPVGYCDSDWAGDLSDRKSVTGHLFMLNGGPVAWRSRKQTVVAKSSSEAEYLAVSNCACEAIWFRNFFSEIGRGFNDRPLPIYVDNQAAIQMSQDPVYMSKTKHIDIAAHHIRDEVSKGKLHLLKIDGKSNPADILTKPLPSELHYRCIQFLGMK